jgi:hypothetical protein
MYLQSRNISSSTLNKKSVTNTFGKSHDHNEIFYSLVKYIVRLRTEDAIDDNTFEELVRLSTSVFVETEISERVNRFLNEKISIDSLMEIL